MRLESADAATFQSPPAATLHAESGRAIYAVYTFAICLEAFPSEDGVDTAVPEARPLFRNLTEPSDELWLVRLLRGVAARRALQARELAGAPLRVTSRLHEPHHLPSHGGRYHFFPRHTFSVSISIANCATSFFSFAFSSPSPPTPSSR